VAPYATGSPNPVEIENEDAELSLMLINNLAVISVQANRRWSAVDVSGNQEPHHK
jgi:hypothetical protein